MNRPARSCLVLGSFLSVVATPMTAPCAHIMWNFLEWRQVQTFDGSWIVAEYNNPSVVPYYILLSFSFTPDDNFVTIDGRTDWHVMDMYASWRPASSGDIANAATTRQKDDYVSYNSHSEWKDGAERPLKVEKDNDFYLMLAAECPDEDGLWNFPEWMYGWVQLHVSETGSITLEGSAIDLSGGPMIVGGGSALTPEPTGAVLFILGGTALVLRRRVG